MALNEQSGNQMADRQTLFEIQVLDGIRIQSKNVTQPTNGLPKLIGPDRSTVFHTTNTLNSFKGTALPRPNYLTQLDIVGTQSRGADISSSDDGFTFLIQAAEGKDVWCTLCNQEWNRVAPKELQITGSRLLAPNQIDFTFWYEYNKSPPTTTPAFQILKSGLQAFVLEAAFPKFVNQVGDNTKYRDWVSDD